MDIDFETLALDIREQLKPGLSPLEAVPLEILANDTGIVTPHGEVMVRAAPHTSLPHHTWGVTTFDVAEDRAWVWLNREAWPELALGVPRTRFTVAHELGHIVIHGEELNELFAVPDGDHHERLEREANAFAARLLLPDAAMKRLDGVRVDSLARRFGVSAVMMGKRFDEWRAK